MRIGELAAVIGTTTKALRFYEEIGLMPAPQRTASGYRDYDEEAVLRLNFIRRGRAAGLTLAQIREILAIRDRGKAPCRHVAELLDSRLAQLDEQIAELSTLRQTVAQLRAVAATGDPDACRPQDICRYL